MKKEFRYERPIDDNYKHWRTYVTVPASKLAKEYTSLWVMDCFPPEFPKWMNDNLVDDCFYNTTDNPWDYHSGEMPANHDRFFFHFYFRNEQDAVLFKLFWG